MFPPRVAVWLALWGASSCLLAVWASSQDEAASQGLLQRPGPPGDSLCSGIEPADPSCPRRKKAATLLPSFTKTTTPSTTRHPKTTHHPTTHAANHTTLPANHTTHHPTNRTTPFHTTSRPANHTTHHPTNRTTPFHTTSRPANHTTHHPTNRTTPFHTTSRPANHTTHHPTNHTTSVLTTRPVNHTTPHPPTPHPSIVTTAPWPTDSPLVAVGDYVVRNGSAACMRLVAGLQLQVQYTSKAKQLLWGMFAVQPNHTNTSGGCSSQEATLRLRFPEGSLVFVFKKNETRGTSYLSRVQANLTYQFMQATEMSFGADASSLQEFEASLGHSYQCRNRTLTLAGDFRLHVLNEQVQAFELQGGKFGEAEVCKEQRRSLLVPIVVIVIIVLLIVIVLVAYAVGRRRSHVGYETL
ncbi:macrosialin [Heteronotia binoei]|uniref:macrosialin n=1 Tax=Heteronotia binoei TaxID=13085 RepID=UPI0029317E32|nr:macrosialin [Heteronotia binoei]